MQRNSVIDMSIISGSIEFRGQQVSLIVFVSVANVQVYLANDHTARLNRSASK